MNQPRHKTQSDDFIFAVRPGVVRTLRPPVDGPEGAPAGTPSGWLELPAPQGFQSMLMAIYLPSPYDEVDIPVAEDSGNGAGEAAADTVAETAAPEPDTDSAWEPAMRLLQTMDDFLCAAQALQAGTGTESETDTAGTVFATEQDRRNAIEDLQTLAADKPPARPGEHILDASITFRLDPLDAQRIGLHAARELVFHLMHSYYIIDIGLGAPADLSFHLRCRPQFYLGDNPGLKRQMVLGHLEQQQQQQQPSQATGEPDEKPAEHPGTSGLSQHGSLLRSRSLSLPQSLSRSLPVPPYPPIEGVTRCHVRGSILIGLRSHEFDALPALAQDCLVFNLTKGDLAATCQGEHAVFNVLFEPTVFVPTAEYPAAPTAKASGDVRPDAS